MEGIWVIFLPKAGKEDYSLPKSFRPITLASFALKGLEKIVMWRLESTTLKKILSPHQHAFIPDRNCDTALAEVTDHIEKANLRGLSAAAVSLDIRGAFDNVGLNAAVQSLCKKGFPFWMTNWYKHYLYNRFSTIEIRLLPLDDTPKSADYTSIS